MPTRKAPRSRSQTWGAFSDAPPTMLGHRGLSARGAPPVPTQPPTPGRTVHSSREPGSTKDQGAPSINSNLTPPSESLCLGQKTNEPTDRSGRPARDASRMYRDPGKGRGEEVRGSQEGGLEALAFKPGAWRTGYSQGKSRRPGGGAGATEESAGAGAGRSVARSWGGGQSAGLLLMGVKSPGL